MVYIIIIINNNHSYKIIMSKIQKKHNIFMCYLSYNYNFNYYIIIFKFIKKIA